MSLASGAFEPILGEITPFGVLGIDQRQTVFPAERLDLIVALDRLGWLIEVFDVNEAIGLTRLKVTNDMWPQCAGDAGDEWPACAIRQDID